MPRGKIDIYIIDQVRRIRMEKGLSQEELSFRLGKAEGYITKFESHNTGKFYNSKMLNEIAKVLQCSPKDFMPDAPL